MPTEAEKRQQQKEAREIRVFLSSTFKDMDNERSHLLKEVFPAIRKVCAERQVAFTEIDLRWGVTEKDAQSGATVEICLREIKRCRDFPPFFIGFLGERYGWIPTNDDLKEYWERLAKNNDKETAALAEKIKKAVEQGISVTELEMQLAVLAADASLDTKVHGNHALFLLRDKSLTDNFYNDTLKKNSKTVKTDFDDAADGKLDALKERIRESGFLGLDNYKSVKDFGEHIKQHLLKAIDDIFPEDQQVDEWEQLDRAHRVFANHRRENFLPRVDVREQILEAIRERVEKPSLGPVVLTGPSGQGKSALMADLAKHLNENQPELELVLEHYVGADGNISLTGWLDRMLHTLHKRLGGEEKGFNIPEATKDKAETLGDWASQAAQKARQENNTPQLKLVCVVDALDQLESTGDLDWLLSETTGADLIVITSVADGTDARAWVEEHIEGQIDVPPLDTDARRKMVTETFKRFRKELKPEYVERLASAEQCGSPLFLRLALEELRLDAHHETLSTLIDEILKAPDAQSLFLTNFLFDEDYNRDQQPDMAVKFMALLGAAYDGLSDEELADLLALPEDEVFKNKPRLPQQYLSQLINNFSPFLLNRNGRYAPMHRLFGETALAKRGEKAIREHIYAHSRSAYGSGVRSGSEGFETRGAAQALYQITQLCQLTEAPADAQTRLFTDLARLDVPARLAENEPTITLAAMNSLAEQQLPELLQQWQQHISELSEEAFNELNDFIGAIVDLIHQVKAVYFPLVKGLREALLQKLETLGADEKKISYALNALGFILQDGSDPDDRLKTREIFERALAIYEQVLGEHPSTATSLNNLALYLANTGNPEDFARARGLYERALAIREKVLGEHPDTAMSLNSLAGYLADTGNPEDFARARGLYERALAIYEKVLGEHPETAMSLNNLAAYLADTGKPEDRAAARGLFERALVITEQVLGEHPSTATRLNNLAVYLFNTGKPEDRAAARGLFERALSIYEQALGEHPDTAMSLNNLALYLKDTGKPEDRAARGLYERALAIYEQALGEHPDTAQSLNNLAVYLWKGGIAKDKKTAFSYQQRAKAIAENYYPENHERRQFFVNQFAWLQKEIEKDIKNNPYFVELIEISKRIALKGRLKTLTPDIFLAGLEVMLMIGEPELPDDIKAYRTTLTGISQRLSIGNENLGDELIEKKYPLSDSLKKAIAGCKNFDQLIKKLLDNVDVDVDVNADKNSKRDVDNADAKTSAIPEANEEVNDEGRVTSMANKKSLLQDPWFLKILSIAKGLVVKYDLNLLKPHHLLLALKLMLEQSADNLPEEIDAYRHLAGLFLVDSKGIDINVLPDVDRKIPLSPDLKIVLGESEDFDSFVTLLIQAVIEQNDKS